MKITDTKKEAKFKSNSFTGSNKERSHIAIAIFRNGYQFNIAPKLFQPTVLFSGVEGIKCKIGVAFIQKEVDCSGQWDTLKKVPISILLTCKNK